MKRLQDIAEYVDERISSTEIELSDYVTTDCLLQNKNGRTIASNLPPVKCNLIKYQKNDILIANIRPYLKKIWYADRQGGASADVLVFRAKASIDPLYLYAVFLQDSFYDYVMRATKGSKMPRGDKNHIMNYIIHPVSGAEEKRIGQIISNINTKIELNKKISRELEAMAKELYDYWFVQFDFPNEQGKPYKSSGGKMVWNETLKREIPEGWEVKKLGDCLEHINTGLNPRDNFKLGNGNIKYVTVKNIAMDGSIDFSGCDYVNEEARKMIHARSKISKGDILFASISPLGRCFILHEEPKDWDINESVFSIRPRSIINSEYLYEYFRSEWFIKKSEKVTTGSIFSGIRIQVLTSLPILIPDKSIIGDFSTKLANLLCQKEKFSQENMILTNLRNQLLPLLMNGQVRVSEEKVSSVLQKDDTNRFILWKNTYPVAARGEKNDTVLRAMYEAMDDEDK